MTSNGVRDDETERGRRERADWGRTGALWTIIGVFVTVIIGVIPFVMGGSGSSSGTTSTTAPVPTTAPVLPLAPEPTTDPSLPDTGPSGSTQDDSDGNRGQAPPSERPSARSSSGPSVGVSPAAVTLGGDIVIRGSGFEPLTGLHIRWFSTASTSNELGRNVPVDEDGSFAAGGPMENPGFCGAGTVAVFSESGSAYEVPDFSEALATARAIIRC